jgi:predicted esterase
MHQPFHLQAGEQDIQNMVAALKAVRRNSWASADNAMLVGMSAGGFAVIATGATNPPGVKAVINFDGGRGAIDGKSLCDKTGLMKSYEQYGKTAKIPSLWLYAKNDKSFPPDMGREMFNAYQQGKNPAQFIVMPSYGKDGHVFMDSAPESFWWNTVATFLEQYHQPFQEIIRLPVVNLIEPPALNAAGKKPFPSMNQRSDMKKHLPPIRTETGALHTGPETVRKLPQRRLVCTKEQRRGAPQCAVRYQQ